MAQEKAPLPNSAPASGDLAKAILATGSDGFGAALMGWLKHVCAFDNFAIIAFLQGCRPKVLMTHAGNARVFERIDSHYVEGAYLLDPFYALLRNEAADGAYRLHDIAPDQFQRNEYFKSYYRNTTLLDEIAFFCRPAPGVAITTCIGRDETTASKFSLREYAAAQRAAPVVNALVRRNWPAIRAEDPAGPEEASDTLRRRLSRDKGIDLSARQSEVALLILQGHSSVSIGLTLGISPQTVKVIRKQLYRKCAISSQGELYYLIAPYLSEQVGTS
jgi:DNA-binding CsgD family transcriptional regulator